MQMYSYSVRPIVSLMVLATALLAVAAPVRANYQELEAIVAVVEDDVVLASELKYRYEQVVKQMQQANMQIPPDDVLMSQLMERLISESIQRQEAERRGINIDDETLTRAVMQFAQNNNMSLEQFQQALLQRCSPMHIPISRTPASIVWWRWFVFG